MGETNKGLSVVERNALNEEMQPAEINLLDARIGIADLQIWLAEHTSLKSTANESPTESIDWLTISVLGGTSLLWAGLAVAYFKQR